MTDSDHQWLASAAALDDWLADLRPDEPLYLDTEFMRERVFWPQLALVQLQTARGCALVDPLALEAATLARLVADRRVILHGGSEDLEVLHHATGVWPAGVGDTQVAAALAGGDLQCGYQRLVRDWLAVELPKGETRTDWLQRPLTPEQLRYAEQDVVYLPPLMERLYERLVSLGREHWWQEECSRLLEEAADEVDPGDLWRGIKGAGRLGPEQRAVLRALAYWREEQARERDRPRGFVVRNADLIQLAEHQPGSAAALRSLGLHPGQVRRDGDAILEQIRTADRQAPPAALPAPLDRDERARIKQLRTEVQRHAEALNVEPEVLMRRRWLEALVRHPDRLPAALRGWRYSVITEPLLEQLHAG